MPVRVRHLTWLPTLVDRAGARTVSVASDVVCCAAVGAIPAPGPRAATPERPGPRALSGQPRATPPRPGRQAGGFRQDIRDGIRLVAATPLLLGITLLMLAAQGLDQGWSAVILPVDVRDKMHSVLALGAAESAFAAGALIGAVLYSMLAERLPRWPVFTIGFLVVGAPRFAVAALTGSPAPLIAVMAIEGLACGPIGPILVTLVPVAFPLYRQMTDPRPVRP